MANAPTVQIQFVFIDRERNTARVTMYLPWAIPVDAAFVWAFGAATRMQALSDANIIRIDIAYKSEIDDPAEASEESAVGRLLLLFIENEAEEINAVAVPSGASGLYETSGRYAGIRIDDTNSAIISFEALLQMFDLRTDLNDELGTTLLTGGMAI